MSERTEQRGEVNMLLNPLGWSYVEYAHRADLPTCAGVYCVLTSGDRMLYIGESQNIYLRWKGHNLRPELKRGSSLRIAWHETYSEAGRMKLETMLIRRYRPRFNAPPGLRAPTLSLPQPPLNLLASLPDVPGHMETPYQILDHLCRHLTPYEQAVYLQLYRLSWGLERAHCRISHPKLADRAHMSLAQVKRVIDQLISQGLIEKTGQVQGYGKDQGVEYLIYKSE